MLIRRHSGHDIKSSEITSEAVYQNRRHFLQTASGIALGSLLLPLGEVLAAPEKYAYADIPGVKPNPKYQDKVLRKAITRPEDFSAYNNFYEFGTDKEDPKQNSKNFKTKPWTVKVHGLVNKPADYQLEDFLKPFDLEDRIYRFRCVEAWSMVVPWVGIPLHRILARAQPTSAAKYVLFKTLQDPTQFPMQKTSILEWPYVEGLRLDEAMHDLSLLTVGAYGKVLPNQNGAPLRLIVPWKYGYKSIKSIVNIELVSAQPKTSWEIRAPDEYPFYSNVIPEVPHPRWSQKTERVIGSGFFSSKQKTLMFNGYADAVASLYSKFDNKKLY
ncbi:MAG: protein-methionine-sulfoxide reductase catalytic subunit MsrP [Pseudobdellovibrionaceae bacterium]|nr:protein-methionine-sulfoxide reductase catalytic subunit MsrP [Pseudobdellovibrionaceae bacterium]